MAIAYGFETPMIEVLKNVRENQSLKDFLVSDRPARAYLLGYLDPMYDPFIHWYANVDDGEIQQLAVLYTGLSLPMVFFAGMPPVDDVWNAWAEVLPKRFQYHAPAPFHEKVELYFPVQSSQNMLRMALSKADYLTLPKRYAKADRLGHRDTAAIMELYRHYPDNLFEPYQLETGLYFAVRGEDQLASIAGIHVFSREYDVAVIGNFVTHPKRRGEGLASACTKALLDELFQGVSTVALNVQVENAAAIKMYENFGFATNHKFVEGVVE